MKRYCSRVVQLFVAILLVAAFSASAHAQCSGGTGAQTGLGAANCTGSPAWTGQAVTAGQTVVYNNCLYKANQNISANPSWCPGCSGIFLYGSNTTCPTAGCNFGAEGTCGSATATPTTRPTATVTATATATTGSTATATTRVTATATATATATTRATATPTTTAAVNLALNHTATASSLETTAFPANLAVDGNTTTRWSSLFADPQWIMVDLGASAAIGRVRLNWEAAHASNYTVQVSTDNVNWTTIKTVTASAGGVEDWTGLSGTGRYVRMFGTTRATQWGYSLFEFEVYGTGGGPTPTATTRPTATSTGTATATVRATATPTSTATATSTTRPTPTATTCTNCGGSLPKHLVMGYWHNWNAVAAPAILLRNVPTSYTIIAVAFADVAPAPAGAGSITFNMVTDLGYASTTDFANDVNLVKGRGQKVIISVGGQNGSVSVGDSTAAGNFASSTVALMNQYHFDGVDIDMENGVNPTFMAQALHSIASQKPGAIITMAPETLFMLNAQSTYLSLAVAVKDVLTMVNTQFYNTGSMNDCNGAVVQPGIDMMTGMTCTAIAAGLRPDQIGLGLPASPAAAGSGYQNPTVVNNALDCLTRGTNCGAFHPPTTWPTIRGAMTWSINYDAHDNNYGWVNTVSGHFSSLP